MGKYLKTDMYRMFHSWQFYVSILGVFVIYLISTLQNIGIDNVVEMFWMIKFYSLFMCIYGISSFAFSNSLLEDLENKFYHGAILRGEKRAYVKSKAACCFLGTVFVVMAGTLLYAVILRIQMPFYESLEGVNVNVESIRKYDIFGSFIQPGGFLLYVLCSGFLLGLLGGMLALLSMLLSLFIRNRMFVISFPVIAYYFLVNYIEGLTGTENVFFNACGIYMYAVYVFENAPFASFIYAVLLAVVVCILLEKLIYRRLCRIWRMG